MSPSIEGASVHLSSRPRVGSKSSQFKVDCGSTPNLVRAGGTLGCGGIATEASDIFKAVDQMLSHRTEEISGLSSGMASRIVLFR